MHGTTRRYQDTPERWEYTIELGRKPDGRRWQVRRRGYPDQPAAEAAMQAELTDRRRGQFIEPSKTTLADYLEDWLAATGPTRSPNTVRSLRECLARAKPIAHIPIGKLQHHHVQAWVNGLSARYAPRTVRVTHAALAQALAQAVVWGHLPRNPATGLILPRIPPRREHAEKAWTAPQAAAFLAATSASDWHPLWRVLLDGQLRLGEALALAWSDLDLDAALLHVRRTLTRDERGWYIGDTAKTPESVRDLTIDAQTVAALRRHRTRQLERRLAIPYAWHDLDLVFPRDDGRLTNPSTITRALARDIAAAGVPKITAHGLRHTGATLLVQAGIPLVVISRRLGHSNINTTADIYVTVTDAQDRAAADALARLLNA